VETSRIRQSGDAEQARSFTFVKPRMVATWNRSPGDQLRLRLERDVAQLDFTEFASAVSLFDGTVDLGNPDLAPERTWRAQLDWERRLGPKALVTLSAFYEQVEDVQDQIPVAGQFDAPGNIGDGRRYGVKLDVLAPLDRVGLPRGELRVRTLLQDTRVQDPVSARPVHLSEALRPAVILDACAGRGTKTKQLASLHPDAEVVATDVDGHRLRALALAFEGHPRVKVTTPEGLRRVVGKVDLLVLDVPCSNTGVLPRRPEAKYRFNRARLDSVVRLQRQIVEEHRPFLAPGGSVLYSTCSLESLENQTQAEWAAGRTGLRVSRVEVREPRGVPGGPDAGYADGGFGALLSAS
jgi:hypothetical protein